MVIRKAILVDGGFYRQRAYKIYGPKKGNERAAELFDYCMKHCKDKHNESYLYRVFYYDCPPISKKIYHPFLKKQIDYGKSELNLWMTEYISELTHQRKFCLRMGKLAEEQAYFNIKSDVVKELCSGKRSFESLNENDFSLQLSQKGVDMKIGIDISSLAYKKQVDQIILISGDSDFVPAAKLARREGIDFILDPMRANIKPDLYEHIDGIKSITPSIKK